MIAWKAVLTNPTVGVKGDQLQNLSAHYRPILHPTASHLQAIVTPVTKDLMQLLMGHYILNRLPPLAFCFKLC